MESEKTYCLCGETYKGQFMVQCEHCKDWFHGSCVNVKEYNVIELDKYHCPRCVPVCGPTIVKPYKNWHRHVYWDSNALGKPVQTGTGVFIRELCARHFSSEGEIVVHMRGQQLTENFLNQNGFNNPIVIDGKDGLDISIPPDNFSLYDVESYIGGDRLIDVIDVMRQCDFKMTLRDFVEYYNTPNRIRIFNCVSLEFSSTSLSRLVEAPMIARRLDWVNTVWPRDLPEDIHAKPCVQKYCLMSVKDSYTDFHVDFGGTSVWYHVLRGEKIFYFIDPTPANLTLYQQWMTSSTQNETFFGDQVDRCYKCVLRQGQTMLIPTGWIHAVLTTVDSLVFGGNFLHSLNIPMQLQVYEIEKKIKTAERFKFPSFEAINWYAAKKIMCQLKEVNSEDKKCPSYFLTGGKALLAVLKQWNTDKDYNMSNREQIPDVINSHKLLKDLGKEVRHAERFLNSLNPPKPERESKRKRKKPVNKDFVDFSMPQKSYELLEPAIKPAAKPAAKSATKQANKPAAKQSGKHTNKSIAKQTTNKVAKPKIISPPLPAARLDFESGPIIPTPTIMQPLPKLSDLPTCSQNSLMPPPTASSSSSSVPNSPALSCASSGVTERSWSEYPINPNERWVVTNVTANDRDRPGAILKFTLGSKEAQAQAEVEAKSESPISVTDSFNYDFTASKTTPQSIFDFNDDTEQKDDEFALKIDDSPKKRRVTPPKIKTLSVLQPKEPSSFSLPPEIEVDLNSDVPKNGIESLLKASALTNKLIDSGRASPSTREAIAGMLSIGQTYSMPPVGSFTTTSSKTARKRKAASPPKDHFEENIRNVHQDDEYIYPSLDNSDEEDCQIFKSRGRSKVDEAWNPKARVGPLLPKMNRPAREGTKKQAVEKVLEAAAAKRATDPITHESHQKRTYRKKKVKLVKSSPASQKDSVYGSQVPTSSSSQLPNTATAVSKQKKGMKTAKQRLGKILKIHKMIH